MVVLRVAGYQVPVMAGLLVELFGNVGGVEFRHNGPILLKVGTTCKTTLMVILAVLAFWPVEGVNI